MGEETQVIKTLDYSQFDQFHPQKESFFPQPSEIENPYPEFLRCHENPVGSLKIEDDQIFNSIDQFIQETGGRDIEDIEFSKALLNSSEDEIKDIVSDVRETLEKYPSDGIDDADFMDTLMDSVQDERPLDKSNTQLDSITNSSGWNEQEACPVGAGLANLGNTCFLNAILQCFTHIVPLVEGLLSLRHDSSSHGQGEFCVLCAVRDQIECSLIHSGRVISPTNLADNLSHISSFFRRYQQEDAHEFLQCLLDKLDCNWSKYEANAKDSSSSSTYSLVKHIFGGRLVSQIRCLKCGHNSDTYEPLIDLSLEIENVDSLESALKSFTKKESIEDTEKFTCGGCNEQVPVEKQLIVDHAPSIAALHLKRFKSDGIYVEKIDKKVEYPLELDLKPYTTGAKDDDEELEYELFGVVVHVGVSSTSGHYFCYIRTAPDTWYRFDDSKVTRVLEETALGQDAYILFYARKGTEWFSDFFEKWKSVSEQKRPRTSPKSVLDDMDLPSTSSYQGPVVQGCESEPSDNRFVINAQHTSTPIQTSAPSSSGVLHDDVKIDRPDSDTTFPMTSAPAPVKNSVDIDPCTPRSQSPDIYSDEEPAPKNVIPVEHLKVGDKSAASAKKAMDKIKNDVKRKEAAKYISKSMPGRRRQSFLAAVMGSQSDNSMNKKRRKQTQPDSHSPKKRSKISPKRVLRPPVTA